ncbi:MAG: PAS domain S-box protein [Spongiibacteraceae bacterium]
MPSRNLPEDKSLMDLQRFQILVEAISDYAIYMLDIDGNIVSWNSGAQRFKGYTPSEIIGTHFSHFFTTGDRARGLPAHALKIAEIEGRFETEGWRIRKDGSRFWANAVIDAIRTEDGRLLGFAKITRDITARQAAEEALRQSEQQFRLLVQGVTDYAIYMLDTTGHVSNWNAGAERIKGYHKDEVVGSHFSRFYTEEDRAAGMPERALAIARVEGRFEQEGWRIRKDGSRFFAHVVIDALHDPTGALAGFAKITRDISEKRAADEALRRTEQALQQAQKMESIGKLTGGVAHDFNNLLQIVSGNLQLLSVELTGNELAQGRIRAALEGVTRGAKLTSYLLAFGRRQALDPKVVNIGRFVVAMEDMLRRTLGESIEIETIISGGLWTTLIDIAQVENALLNLAINARDAMEDGGKLTIEVGNAYLDDAYARIHPDVSAGQYVMLAVTDTGKGMTPEVLAQAYEPFFSTKPEGKGTGLGLSMVYGFVKQSGGHIQIYSEVGYGTTVKLYLQRSLKAEDATPVATNTAALGGSGTILVAEDDEQLCNTVVDMLKQLGYHVLKVHDAAGALTIIESGIHIDLLFTDVVMPGPLRSPELAQRAKLRLPDLAVVFTSGYTQNAIVHGGRLDPGVELLPKPYTREALARKIGHVLANQRQLAKLRAEIARLDTSPPLQAHPPADALHILLVEDEPLIRANTSALLNQLGHSVISAESAETALEALESTPVDVLITDVELPGLSGATLAQEIKKQYPAIGIIYATGHSRPEGVEGAVLLQKPYDINSIVAALSALHGS